MVECSGEKKYFGYEVRGGDYKVTRGEFWLAKTGYVKLTGRTSRRITERFSLVRICLDPCFLAKVEPVRRCKVQRIDFIDLTPVHISGCFCWRRVRGYLRIFGIHKRLRKPQQCRL